jgi:hypothetical protein
MLGRRADHFGSAAVLDTDEHLACHIADGELSDDAVASVLDLLDALAPEPELGKLLDVGEIWGPKVRVAQVLLPTSRAFRVLRTHSASSRVDSRADAYDTAALHRLCLPLLLHR